MIRECLGSSRQIQAHLAYRKATAAGSEVVASQKNSEDQERLSFRKMEGGGTSWE